MLSYLAAKKRLDLLPKLYGTVIVPKAVLEEMRCPSRNAAAMAFGKNPPNWVQEAEPKTVDYVFSHQQFRVKAKRDLGEAHAVALAQEYQKQGAEVLLLSSDKDVHKAIAKLHLEEKEKIDIFQLDDVLGEAAENGLIGDLMEEVREFEEQGIWTPGKEVRKELQELSNDIEQAREQRMEQRHERDHVIDKPSPDKPSPVSPPGGGSLEEHPVRFGVAVARDNDKQSQTPSSAKLDHTGALGVATNVIPSVIEPSTLVHGQVGAQPATPMDNPQVAHQPSYANLEKQEVEGGATGSPQVAFPPKEYAKQSGLHVAREHAEQLPTPTSAKLDIDGALNAPLNVIPSVTEPSTLVHRPVGDGPATQSDGSQVTQGQPNYANLEKQEVEVGIKVEDPVENPEILPADGTPKAHDQGREQDLPKVEGLERQTRLANLETTEAGKERDVLNELKESVAKTGQLSDAEISKVAKSLSEQNEQKVGAGDESPGKERANDIVEGLTNSRDAFGAEHAMGELQELQEELPELQQRITQETPRLEDQGQQRSPEEFPQQESEEGREEKPSVKRDGEFIDDEEIPEDNDPPDEKDRQEIEDGDSGEDQDVVKAMREALEETGQLTDEDISEVADALAKKDQQDVEEDSPEKEQANEIVEGLKNTRDAFGALHAMGELQQMQDELPELEQRLTQESPQHQEQAAEKSQEAPIDIQRPVDPPLVRDV